MDTTMNDPVVTIRQGALRGLFAKDLDGNAYLKFCGIPYAQPPLRNLRFKAPRPPLPWTGILDAQKDCKGCFAQTSHGKGFTGSENCLFLNVYTPKLPDEGRTTPRPVMVFIHGGRFVTGSNRAILYGPEFLMTADVVLVVPNFRLGLLGFLSCEDPSLGIPGNTAYKDMVMALKWVRDNIRAFNGDPDNITIFGESSGAVAVHLLTLSPMTKGLFHKAIVQSGSALNSWANGQRLFKPVCEILKIKDEDPKKALERLQEIAVEKLIQSQSEIYAEPDYDKIYPYGYVVEEPSDEEPAFLTEYAIDIINSGKFERVPLMIGFTKDEGMYLDLLGEEFNTHIFANFECNIPHMVGIPSISEEGKKVAEQIKKFYFKDEDPCKTRTQKAAYDLTSDNLILYAIHATVRKYASLPTSNLYFYQLSLQTSLQFLSILMKMPHKGVIHGDDIAYLFKTFMTPAKLSPLEHLSIKRIVKLWTNFARFGNPTPDETDPMLNVIWEKASADQIAYLNIGQELKMECDPYVERMKFWDSIFATTPSGAKYLKKIEDNDQ